MNKYYTTQTSQTLGTVVMAGILASSFSPPDGSHKPSSSMPNFSEGHNYRFAFRETSPTHEPTKNILTEHYPSSTKTAFESVATRFFEELSSNQEPLGHEFEQILFENLWDLYQS
jgi:hypothetical protein